MAGRMAFCFGMLRLASRKPRPSIPPQIDRRHAMTRQRISVSYRTAIIAVALWCLPFRDCRATETSFERDVRPILKAHCWHCHGEEPELKGGLDARLVRSILRVAIRVLLSLREIILRA